jgi:hypothetical protein
MKQFLDLDTVLDGWALFRATASISAGQQSGRKSAVKQGHVRVTSFLCSALRICVGFITVYSFTSGSYPLSSLLFPLILMLVTTLLLHPENVTLEKACGLGHCQWQ